MFADLFDDIVYGPESGLSRARCSFLRYNCRFLHVAAVLFCGFSPSRHKKFTWPYSILWTPIRSPRLISRGPFFLSHTAHLFLRGSPFLQDRILAFTLVHRSCLHFYVSCRGIGRAEKVVRALRYLIISSPFLFRSSGRKGILRRNSTTCKYVRPAPQSIRLFLGSREPYLRLHRGLNDASNIAPFAI